MNTSESNHRLSRDMLELMSGLFVNLGPSAVVLRQQLEAARVLRYGSTMVDIEVPSEVARVDLPNGPLPFRATVLDGSGQCVGELLVWIREGVIIGLEQAWVTDDTPTDWPTPERIRLA